jgi:hypothetical protein
MAINKDFVMGVIAGLVIWYLAFYFLNTYQWPGWIIAAVVGGFIAGRLGGFSAASTVAVLSTLIIFNGIEINEIYIVSTVIFIKSIIASLDLDLAMWVATILIAIGHILAFALGAKLGSNQYYSAQVKTTTKTSTMIQKPPSKEAVIDELKEQKIGDEIRDKPPVAPLKDLIEQKLPEKEVEEEPAIKAINEFTQEQNQKEVPNLPQQKAEAEEMLSNLKKRLTEGKVSEGTYNELKKEYEDKIKTIDAEIQRNRVTEAEREEIQRQIEQMRKRFVDGEISEETYKELRKEYQEKMKNLSS